MEAQLIDSNPGRKPRLLATRADVERSHSPEFWNRTFISWQDC